MTTYRHLYILQVMHVYVCFLLSLSVQVLNSRDRHEKNGDQILHTTKHILQKAVLE